MNRGGFCPVCSAEYDVKLDDHNDIVLITVSCEHHAEINDEANERRGENE